MTKVRAILFDFGGTLDLGSHWLDRFLDVYRRAGFDLERGEFDPAFGHATREGYSAGKRIEGFGLKELVGFLVAKQIEHLRTDGPERIRRILREAATERRPNPVEEIRDAFVKQTSRGLRRNRRVLEELRPRFRLGVVSNWYGNLEAVLEEAGMRSLIDMAVDSTRVGFFKPDPRIFEAALDGLGVSGPEAAMVGDSLLKDCAPAHRLGMRTVLLGAARGKPDGENIEGVPDYVIGSLDEILALPW